MIIMTNVNININSDLISKIEDQTGLKINELIENYLELLLNNNSIEGNLINKMVKTRKELDRLEKEFITIKKAKIRIDNPQDLKRPFKMIKDIYNRYEEVGRNLIGIIAQIHNVSAISLEQLCIDENIPLINFQAPVR